MLLRDFGVVSDGALDHFDIVHRFIWHGSQRTVELVFDNVRDQERLPDSALRPSGDGPRIVIDLPFDDGVYGPRDDIARVQRFRQEQPACATVCWLPNFFGRELQRDLGTLVILEFCSPGNAYRRTLTTSLRLSGLSRRASSTINGPLFAPGSAMPSRRRMEPLAFEATRSTRRSTQPTNSSRLTLPSSHDLRSGPRSPAR